MSGDDDASRGLQVYLVGGAVRDRLMRRKPGDRDWVVVGATPEEMTVRGFRPVGRDFPVFLHPESSEEYALARTERKSGPGYRGFVMHADASVTLEQDLARRDFTINAIAEGADGILVDPFNGARDIERLVLRHVTDAFVEDPVRVLRAARLMARFAGLGFSIADETMELMRRMVEEGEVDHLVPERVWAELRRALAESRPSAFLRTLRDCGALARVLPEVDALYGVPQRAEYHPEVDTGIHQELVLDMAARLAPGDERVGYAALCHDLGKALTPKDQLPRHIGHEQGGMKRVRALSERLRVPVEHRDEALIACREHLNVHRLDELRPATVVALLERCDAFRKPDRIDRLAIVCEADKRGRAGLAESAYPQASLLIRLRDAARAVQARDVIEPGLEGEAIAERLREARVAAVAAVPR